MSGLPRIRSVCVERGLIGALAATLAVALLANSVALAVTLRGTNRSDTLVGTPHADIIYTYAGDDDLYGGRGRDHLYGGAGKDHISAGDGNDVVVGGPPGDLALDTPFTRHERIFGGAGDDVIIMRVAGSILFAGAGDDRIDVRDPQSACKIRPRDRAPTKFGGTNSRGPALVDPARVLDPPHCVNIVNTGPGDNFVRADDGNHDSISCVGRRDRVIIDQYDVVPDECEVVRRVRR